jgi:hypothetical protein
VNAQALPNVPFGWLADLPVEADKALACWQTRLTAIRKESGLNDLGPDLALVGPGDAYVRGLEADGKPVGKELLRPEPLPGGRVVLLREGKATVGFHHLQDALNAARDGDVVEIRTDAKLNAGEVAQDRGSLTLRAGLGYRPVLLTALIVRPGSIVAVEGLTFSRNSYLSTERVKDVPLEKQGRISRLAHCAFEPPEAADSLDCLLAGKESAPAEIRRCLVSGHSRFGIDRNATLRIRDCVLGPSWLRGAEDRADAGTLELEACIMSGPAPFYQGWLLSRWGQEEFKVRCVVRRCLFESNASLFIPHGPKELLSWKGERNCYRISAPWAYDQGVWSLTQWRAFTGSPETGSVEGDPTIADPRTWKLRQDGAVGGADVDRVARPTAEVPAPPPASSKAAGREKPFVLMRKGAEAGSFKTFAALWETHQPGDEIVVHGDGPFPLPQVQVKDRALVLKAAPGFRPVFYPDESLFESQREPLWIRLEKSALTVEGCDFGIRNLPPNSLVNGLVGGGNGPIVFRNCRFQLRRLVGDLQALSLTLEDCLLLSFIDGLGSLPPRCEVTLTNNLIWPGESLWRCLPPGGQVMRLRHNTVILHGGTLAVAEETTRFQVTAEGNLFDFRFRPDPGSGPLRTQDLKGMTWEGKDNCYAGLAGDFAAWNARLPRPEVNSRAVSGLPFGWLTDPPGEAAKALPWWQTRLPTARKESSLHDLGPDLSLVGPGDAYLRGLEAEGKPVGKDQLRPEPLPGGRVVLLREGKATEGFHHLQDALNAARDGDVVEIRTDAKLAAGEVPRERGRLTLRAGPGYRPVLLTKLYVWQGNALTVEGLTFSRDAFITTQRIPGQAVEKQGRISRIAHCAFEWRDPPEANGEPSLECLFAGKEGAPAEMSRCFVPGPIRFGIDRNATLRIRECVLGPLWPRGAEDRADAGTLELEGCIVSRPAPIYGVWLLSRWGLEEFKVRCVVRRCLFETHTFFFRPNGPKELLSWKGERNCYRISAPWTADQGVYSLAQWRAYTGSPETGSAEGDPAIADPRMWKLPSGSPAAGAGADVDRVGRRTPTDAGLPKR